jgi:hypothetical protein
MYLHYRSALEAATGDPEICSDLICFLCMPSKTLLVLPCIMQEPDEKESKA